jgi:hypothetical protein
MKLVAVILGLAILGLTEQAKAQSTEPSKPEQQGAEVIPAPQISALQDPRAILPDAPIPTAISPIDGPYPCPGGIGKPCALLGGRAYFLDLSQMTQHDRSWKDSLRNPALLIGEAANIGAAVWDYKTTRVCIDTHRGYEANPLMGQSRVQEIGVSIGLNVVLYLLAAKLKKDGNGNIALAILGAGTSLHVAAASHNRSICSN